MDQLNINKLYFGIPSPQLLVKVIGEAEDSDSFLRMPVSTVAENYRLRLLVEVDIAL